VLILYGFFLYGVSGQIKETLATPEERAWQKQMRYLYVFNRGGVSLFSMDLQRWLAQSNAPENTDNNTSEAHLPDDVLFGGVVSAISMMLAEISTSNAPLKTIHQEGFTIYVEETDLVRVVLIANQELVTLRQKLIAFMGEFHQLFGSLLKRDYAEVNAYLAAETLVATHFGR
jgi:hypothetical protein